MNFLWNWIMKLVSAGDPNIHQGTERRFRCIDCFEVNFFYADPLSDTTFNPKCIKCGKQNKLHVLKPKDKNIQEIK